MSLGFRGDSGHRVWDFSVQDLGLQGYENACYCFHTIDINPRAENP